MTGVPVPYQPEQLTFALIPASLPRPRPPPLPIVDLPTPPTPLSAQDHVEVFAGRVDPSGRIPVVVATAALGWPAGRRLRVDVVGRSVALRVDPTAPVRAGGAVVVRAQIGLPIAVRMMCGIELGSTVVLAAFVDRQVLVIQPQAEVVRLLRRTHLRILAGSHAR